MNRGRGGGRSRRNQNQGGNGRNDNDRYSAYYDATDGCLSSRPGHRDEVSGNPGGHSNIRYRHNAHVNWVSPHTSDLDEAWDLINPRRSSRPPRPRTREYAHRYGHNYPPYLNSRGQRGPSGPGRPHQIHSNQNHGDNGDRPPLDPRNDDSNYDPNQQQLPPSRGTEPEWEVEDDDPAPQQSPRQPAGMQQRSEQSARRPSFSEANYFARHQENFRKWAVLKDRPSALGALWHICPFCVMEKPHIYPPSHILSNLNLFSSLRMPPTEWDAKTNEPRSFIGGFSCWGLGDSRIVVERNDLTGCETLNLKDVCYCPAYPDEIETTDTGGLGLNVLCLTRLRMEGCILRVDKFQSWGWVQVFEAEQRLTGFGTEGKKTIKFAFLIEEKGFGLWEIVVCRKPGPHNLHQLVEQQQIQTNHRNDNNDGQGNFNCGRCGGRRNGSRRHGNNGHEKWNHNENQNWPNNRSGNRGGGRWNRNGRRRRNRD